MVDHFHDQVIAQNKIGGQARAMVVTSGIERAIQYYHAISAYLVERKSPYRAIVAFSGEHEYGGAKVTEASLNGFPSNDIADKIEQDPYRFLICADKFQTGYDQPLLHTMYVDKVLSGHQGGADAVTAEPRPSAEARRLRARLHERCRHDPRSLRGLLPHDDPQPRRPTRTSCTIFKADLDAAAVYTAEQVDDLVGRYLAGADRDQLDPILDACVAVYRSSLDEDGQVDFKGKAKAFTRTYAFLAHSALLKCSVGEAARSS